MKKILTITILTTIISLFSITTVLNAKEIISGNSLSSSKEIISGGNGSTGQAPYTYYDYDPGDGNFRGYFRNGTTYNGETANFVTSNIAFSPKDTFMAAYSDGYIQFINSSSSTPPDTWSNIPQESKDKMGIAYSYGAKRLQVDKDLDWLLAINLFIENHGNIIDSSSFPSELKEKVDAINLQILNYNLPPSFMENLNSNIELEWNNITSRYEVTLTDTTGIFDEKWLNKFLAIDGTSNLHFEDPIGDNNLLIYTSDSNASATIDIENSYMPNDDISFTDGVTNVIVPTNLTFYETTYSHNLTGSSMVSGINYTFKITPSFSVKKSLSNLSLLNCGYVNDNCLPLENSVFTLQDLDTNTIDTQTTNSNGSITFHNIPVGNYKVEQTSVSPGYILNSQIFDIDLNESNDNFLINLGNPIENIPIQGNVSLRKVGIKSNTDTSLLPLEGVEFTIFKDENKDSQLDNGDSEIEVLKTDINGEILSSNLAFGNYIIQETKALPGYINNNYLESFIIDDTNTINLNAGMDLVNDIKHGNVSVTTVGINLNDDSQIPLNNTRLLIYKDENSNGQIDDEDTEIESLTTNDIGKAMSSNLIYGDYIIVETDVNDEYILNDNNFLFSIKEDGNLVSINDGQPIVNIKKDINDLENIDDNTNITTNIKTDKKVDEVVKNIKESHFLNTSMSNFNSIVPLVGFLILKFIF